jgi:hypothetical protein
MARVISFSYCITRVLGGLLTAYCGININKYKYNYTHHALSNATNHWEKNDDEINEVKKIILIFSS